MNFNQKKDYEYKPPIKIIAPIGMKNDITDNLQESFNL